MESLGLSDNQYWFFIGYCILIFIYLVILRLLLNFLQQLTQKNRTQRSIVDVDIHEAMNPRMDDSMRAFDPYPLAIVVVRATMAVIGMAIVLLVSYVKIGLLGTAGLVIAAILLSWAYSRWINQHNKTELSRSVQHFVQTGGSYVSVILLFIALGLVTVALVAIH